MGVRSRILAASALGLGAFAASTGPAAADETFSRTDTFKECQVESRLVLLDSGSIEASTRLLGSDANCYEATVAVRVTYVDGDGDPREVVARSTLAVRHTFAAPGATDVGSAHSVSYTYCNPEEPGDCDSPDYRLGSK